MKAMMPVQFTDKMMAAIMNGSNTRTNVYRDLLSAHLSDLNLRENIGISLTRARERATDTIGSVHELRSAIWMAGECAEANATNDPTNRAQAGVGRPMNEVV